MDAVAAQERRSHMFGRGGRKQEPEVAAPVEGRRRGRWLLRLIGLGTVIGAGALWRQRQQQRELDEELWGEPEER
jgi:hypothetical protein